MCLPEESTCPPQPRLAKRPRTVCAGRWVCFSRIGTWRVYAGSLRASRGHRVFLGGTFRGHKRSGLGTEKRERSFNVRSLEQERRARGSPRTQRRPCGTPRAPLASASRCFFFFFFCYPLFSVFLCFETKAQLMDSWRSEDPLPGATLMYCCPISAFNWCPRGRAGLELGHSLLSPLPHTGKVKFITHWSNPVGARAREGGREGRERDSSVSQSRAGVVDKGPDRPVSTQFPDSLSGLAGGLGRLCR